jgi:hypothetical protein
MNPQSSHLDQLMTALRMENHALAARVGTSRQTIWKLRTGYTRMLPGWAKRIAPHLGVPWPELVEGAPVGESPDPSLSERELLGAFRSTDEQGREMILRFTRSLRSDTPEERVAAE